MVIYRTTNLVNGKFYVGKDANNDPTYLGSGVIIKKAIKKYGEENFRKEILEECYDLDNLAEREIYWIQRLDATNKEIAYNIATGGLGGDTITHNPNREEICRKRSESCTGLKRSEETCKKIGDIHRGKIVSDETRAKQSKSQKKRFEEQGISDITREKLRERSTDHLIKKYILIDPEGNEHTTHDGVRAFCREHGLIRKCITEVISGKAKQHRGWTLG